VVAESVRPLTMKTTELLAVVGIAGTLLGTLVGVAATLYLEVGRRRREDRTRFHSDLYQHCVELYVASILWADRMHLAAGRPDYDEWSLIDRLMTAYAHVRMVAGPELMEAAARLVNQCIEHDPADDPENKELSKAVEDVREGFADAAHNEFGVPIDPGRVRSFLAHFIRAREG
jgi:hypothetical protein